MPIASYRHNLPKSEDGKDWFIIRMKRPKSTIMENVRFSSGEGRTKHEQKAMMFDEQFGYEIILPLGHPGWTLVKPSPSTEPEKYEWELDYDVIDEGEDVETFPGDIKRKR